MYHNSLIAKTIFEDFDVFYCCIFVTKYAEFHFINIQKYLSYEQHDLWTMRSSEYCKYFRKKLTWYVYFAKVFVLFYLLVHFLCACKMHAFRMLHFVLSDCMMMHCVMTQRCMMLCYIA